MTHYALDARTATPHFPGIGRYVTSLAQALAAQLRPDERLTLLVQPEHPVRLPAGAAAQAHPAAVSPFSLAQQRRVPGLLRRLAADLYHSPYYLMPYRPGVHTVLTVYDVIPLRHPEHSSARARLLFRLTTALALRSARQVIAISEAARQDFIADFRISPERIRAIPLAADPAFRPQPPEAIQDVRRRYNLPGRFVLYLGSNKPHKNLVRLVQAWNTMEDGRWKMEDCKLIIAGAWDPRYPEAKELAESFSATSVDASRDLPSSICNLQSILWLGRVPEADLPALYSAAAAFVFPSLYEGFGLPVLEAMACGAPVVCSNVSSLPETAGDAALLVDPTDAAALADALRRVLAEPGLAADLRGRGLAQAARFTWERAAAETLHIYRQAAS
ncbi:MAG: D-inositol 3-phosphate glycosyltransferase [Chloroflexi bacterium ADurb.Bin325]|nr:MAG: D-inositol 3-phosphate glycosyltransferase [Chloroflexi bacterium ADurb.Bin325]